MLQTGCLLQHAAPSMLLAHSHVARAWLTVAHKLRSSRGSAAALQSATRCLSSCIAVNPNEQAISSQCTPRAGALSATHHLQLHNSSTALLRQGDGNTARLLLQQQRQQQQHSWGLKLYSQTTASSSAPAEASAQQQQQQQPGVPSASEAATSSFITAPPAAAAGTPAATAGSATAAAAAAASVGGVLAGGVAAHLKEYSMRQVSKHASDETCWIVVNGKVYDVTSYIDDHPGGAESILLNAGVDCTEEFMGVHSQEAKELLEKFAIGTVKPGTKKPPKQPAVVVSEAAAAAAAADPSVTPVTLKDPRERYALPLAAKQRLNHDTYFMRFALPSPRHLLGLPCGKHVFLCADIGGEAVVRAYTPISGDRDPGVLEFLIKVYWAGVHPKFPQGGKMTQHLAAMKEGDTIDVKGPYGKFTYEGQGSYTLNRVPGQARYLSMICGGSGITPCYSVLREVLRDPADTTRCALIYANKHEEDIWLKQELDDMALDNPERFHLWYVVEEPGTPPTPFLNGAAAAATGPAAAESATPWRHSKGYITWDMMAQHLLPPQPMGGSQQQQQQLGGSLALMCGPPGMLEHVVVPGLAAMGYTAEQMVVF